MPKFQVSDPRHPVNVGRALHQGALRVFPPGTIIEPRVWNAYVRAYAGVDAKSSVQAITYGMRDRGMVRLHPGDGVELRGLDLVILPGGWREPAAAATQPPAPAPAADPLQPRAVPA